MKSIVLCDTSSSLSLATAAQHRVRLIPLSIMVDNQEYQDLTELTAAELYQSLAEDRNIKTSQPNLGMLEVLLNEYKDYDQVLVITLSQTVSGTYSSVMTTVERLGLTNFTVLDCGVLGAAMGHAACVASQLLLDGVALPAVLERIKVICDSTLTFILPQNLNQLKKGGRISGATAALSNLLKIKVLLDYDINRKTIEKFETTRSQQKAYQIMLDQFKLRKIDNKYLVYIMHAQGENLAHEFKALVNEHFPNIEVSIVELPATLAGHAGLGCIAIQTFMR